ncbi:MAG: chromosomal replication initiator protein DnaA [Deltaproteobacteria bacterium]|nr:chromosomal replication initiator protein DnaA [Candidatus Tharpella sp.]
MDDKRFWSQILEQIQNEVSDRDFKSFFKDIELKERTDNGILIEFPNSFVKEWIRDNHADIFPRIASLINTTPLTVKTLISKKKKPFIKKTSYITESSPQNRTVFDNLKQEFTFENFVVGPPNQFCHAAAKAVAKQPGTSYNPLFIYSVPGLGKTHLLNAIGNYAKAQKPGINICYVTSEDFTNEMVDAIMEKKMAEFRNKYRQIDILLIDDIQFIAGKDSTEEEFFHTFNTLEKNQKQIVMTSDLLPNDIPKLESRLRSRFQMGLIADIQPPDKETLVAILITKANQENIPLKKDVAFFLADHLSNLDIRRIIGTLNRIAMLASFNDRDIIDIAFAKKTLEELNILSWDEINITIEEIIKAVADHFKLSTKDMLSRKKTKKIVFPRQIAMYLSRTITEESYPEIGNKFGGKDHATVMHACKKIDKEISLDRKIATIVENLKESITSP